MSFSFRAAIKKSKDALSYRSGARAKGRKPMTTEIASAVRWIVSFCATLFLAWALLFPEASGRVGAGLNSLCVKALGGSAYVALGAIFYGLWLYFQAKPAYTIWAIGAFLTILGSSVIFSALGAWLATPIWGGLLGSKVYAVLHANMGAGGIWIAAVAVTAGGLQLLFAISWRKFFAAVSAHIVEDYRIWVKARGEFKEQVRAAAEKLKKAEPPPAIELPAAAVAAGIAIATPPVVVETKAEKASAGKKAKMAIEEPGDIATDEAPAQPAKKYKHPCAELLSKKTEASRGPSETEIQGAVGDLDKTLASFEIGARVTAVLPGPVITRYEVTPAPGVTVNSIAARSTDIALAMKARGIRMITPIPGKAAIGIELPNQHPAGVTLREVLESSAMAANKRQLAFAMGLASDGTPVAADLQTLPHLLIAGATNSGKSVTVHALIQSILFRTTPQQVKFLLIDPKRIELSLYDGIPQLYDPKTPCENVSVITNSKEAARSLKALLTVMESRYEKFQAYKVRDIEGYNQLAAKEGRPPEFYIVVVIDELADLMVVARDVVEDSIQRLAQMARAVGIHLVLATQRPSVDVITGVIKANLPARIALRVASKIDSKVILDQNGAEALVGKGDMLYLAPGQEPVRIQGAYVSTEEIGQVVEYLKTQGKPQYPIIGGLAAVGHEDLSKFGVEPIEFNQALELVMERRRVSQDLLKSQFGSSARATNLLSLLEVKGFIHKPEGTNRWEIHFDQIEDYLKANRGKEQPRPGSGPPPGLN